MSHQYQLRLPSAQREIAHWRGARSGMRVLGLPSCVAWLHRQADDPDYDYWLDLALSVPPGAKLPRPEAIPATEGLPQAVFVLHKESNGRWCVEPVALHAAETARPLAANCGSASTGAGEVSLASTDGSGGAPAPAPEPPPEREPAPAAPSAAAEQSATVFIIEMQARKR